MMGLTAREKEGCRLVLHQLDTSNLLSLYHTVTKAKMHLPVRAELIEKIMEHSQSAEELLNRKKIYKDIIQNYLNNKKVFTNMKSTKFELIKTALKYWQEQDVPVTLNVNVMENLKVNEESDDPDLSKLLMEVHSLSINNHQEDHPAASQPNVSVGLPDRGRGASYPKESLQKGQRASRPKGKSKPSAPSTISQSNDGADLCVSQSFSYPQKTVHKSNPKPKATSQKSPVNVTVTVSTEVSVQNTNAFSQDRSVPGTRTIKR